MFILPLTLGCELLTLEEVATLSWAAGTIPPSKAKTAALLVEELRKVEYSGEALRFIATCHKLMLEGSEDDNICSFGSQFMGLIFGGVAFVTQVPILTPPKLKTSKASSFPSARDFLRSFYCGEIANLLRTVDVSERALAALAAEASAGKIDGAVPAHYNDPKTIFSYVVVEHNGPQTIMAGPGAEFQIEYEGLTAEGKLEKKLWDVRFGWYFEGKRQTEEGVKKALAKKAEKAASKPPAKPADGTPVAEPAAE